MISIGDWGKIIYLVCNTYEWSLPVSFVEHSGQLTLAWRDPVCLIMIIDEKTDQLTLQDDTVIESPSLNDIVTILRFYYNKVTVFTVINKEILHLPYPRLLALVLIDVKKYDHMRKHNLWIEETGYILKGFGYSAAMYQWPRKGLFILLLGNERVIVSSLFNSYREITLKKLKDELALYFIK